MDYLLEVQVSVQIMYKFARYSSHKAENDIKQIGKALNLENNLCISIRSDKSSIIELQ